MQTGWFVRNFSFLFFSCLFFLVKVEESVEIFFMLFKLLVLNYLLLQILEANWAVESIFYNMQYSPKKNIL